MATINPVFQALEGSQSLALSCPCDEILYEGTRGPGKTATQLMRFRARVGMGYGPFWRGVIFDVEYKHLADIIAQSRRFFNAVGDGARFLSSSAALKWTWPTGEELLFRCGSNEADYWGFHGQEFPFIGVNELTKQHSSKFYESMFSCMRSSFRPGDHPIWMDGDIFERTGLVIPVGPGHPRATRGQLPKIPLEAFSTTNPFGVGHSWVKKRFIDPAPRGTIIRTLENVYNPQTKQEEQIELRRVAIHGSYRENPYLDPKYVATLQKIRDPNKRKAWLYGSWDVTSGGRFDHLWNEAVHVIKPFQIPASWTVDRSHDWGESKPFANLWWAQADGTEATLPDGRKYCPPAGTLFLIAEWYGCDPDELNTGINMSSTNVAKGVRWVDQRLVGKDVPEPREIQLDGVTRGQMHLVPGICHRVERGPADSAIYTANDDELSIGQKMEAQGVEWRPANKAPGSRLNGASLFCDLLEAALEARDKESGLPEKPAFYVFDHCRGWISRVPVLSRDEKNPDDVDTQQEDHDWDATRYRVLHSPFKPAYSIDMDVTF